MQRLLQAVLQNATKNKAQNLEKLTTLRQSDAKPIAVVVACVDARLLTSRFLGFDIGEAYVARNPGNLIPRCCTDGKQKQHAAGLSVVATLQLACCVHEVREIIVCGHSDCKAIKLLWDIKDEKDVWDEKEPLKSWVGLHGRESLKKWTQAMATDKPLPFLQGNDRLSFEFQMDRKKWNLLDQLSQVNCLLQLEHIASHACMSGVLANTTVHLNAIWVDFSTGTVYRFSKEKRQFMEIGQNSPR